MREGVINSLIVCAFLTLSLTAEAQGTRADYERSENLKQATQGKVFRTNVSPHWIDDHQFWYRNDLSEGKREFVWVDPAKNRRRPAFDASKVAQGLSQVLGQPVEADKLPIESLRFQLNKGSVLFHVREKSFECDLKTYTVHPVQEKVGQANPLSPATAHTSREGGQPTEITFVNQLKEPITVYWVDTEGAQHKYATMKAGESYHSATYTGHLWLTAHADGKSLAAFFATSSPTVAVIDGKEPPRPAPENLPGMSQDRRWRLFVRDHNLVLIDSTSKEETLVTTDGTEQDSYTNELWWSPNSRYCAVMKVAPAQEHKVYLVESSPKSQIQPKLRTLDYLKPGDKIEKPRLCIVDTNTKKVRLVAETLSPTPFNLMEQAWALDSKTFTFLYNQRGHQLMRWIGVDAISGEARTIIEEKPKTFISWTSRVYLRPVPDKDEAIWMSERDGWNHLYLYDTKTGDVKSQITKGAWVVRGIERVDEENRQIWFRACGNYSKQDPYYIHYGRVNFDGSGLMWLTSGDGTHKVEFSPDRQFYVDTYSRVDLPPVTELHRTIDGKKVLDLEAGDASALLATGWKAPERFIAKGRDGQTDIFGVIWRPSNFDPAKKYPVIENIYAGPHDSFVPKAWASFYNAQELAELGFIVVQMDGMGTANRSKAFHDVCWKNIADAGFPDRILWIKAVGRQYTYLDTNRIGIYGTSAGGQNSLGGMLLHSDFYKAAVSDCGCHDNRMDKIWWNEQWMGYPVEKHYDEQSNVTLAPNLKGKLFLMVGEMDTNVDPSSTYQVVNRLIQAGKDFDLLVSPGTGHGVLGLPYARRRMKDFFVRNLLGIEPRAN